MRGLYAIIDPARCQAHSPLSLAEAVLRGGCCALQLREKRGDDAAYVALGGPLRQACARAGVPFVVNDRPAAARALGADGLHLGQDDVPLPQARAIVGAGVRLGLSTHSRAQAQAALAAGADLVGFGPVFATRSKRDPDPVVGPAEAGALCGSLPIPVVAIGGIGEDNLAAVIAAGVRVAAVISALADAADPEAVAARMHRALGGQR